MANLEQNNSESHRNRISTEDYHESSNFRLGTSAGEDEATNKLTNRRVMISDKLPNYTSKTNPYYKDHQSSRYSTFIVGIDQFDPYQELTATQIAAFRQVFDIVDKDGKGSIDAEELYSSMKDLDSGLKLDEIKEIVEELDRNGNGEIDFEEFLYMMTSMSVQIKEAQENASTGKQEKRKQNVVFSVITKFAMRHSLEEIERYYASKMRSQPHVVGHYAAGARMFGLSDKTMLKTWKKFSYASKGKDSPYAQPLDFGVDYNNGKRKKKTRRVRSKKKSILSSTTSVSATPSHSSLFTTSTCSPPKLFKNKDSTYYSTTTGVCYERPKSSAHNDGGWTPRHRLPITKVKLPKFNLNNTKKMKGKKLNIMDMDTIRQRVNDARNIYYSSLHEENQEKAQDYWDSLKINEMPSKRLQTNFKRVFRAYSPTNESKYRCNVSPPKSSSKKLKKKHGRSRDKSNDRENKKNKIYV